MPSEMSKAYDPAAVQAEVAALWDAEKCFHAEPTDPGEAYSVVIPPPNVTAALHLGHALNNTVQDILVRRARMDGKNAVWLPGTDHAGIATQTVVEKRVLKEEGKRRTDFERDVFVQKIQAWKDEYEQVILGQLKAMGCSCDWDRTAFTMDEPRAKAVREAFFRLFKAGLIYRGKRLVNWDPATQTALADDEVEMEDVDGHFYFLKYPLEDGSGHITVATTRPETMLGDTAVAVNPTDPRAAALKGKSVRLPIVNRVIPIIEDNYVVKPVQYGGDPADPKAQMATGFLKVTPAHDTNDYDIGQRHGLPVINVMAPDATISDKHGWPDVGDAAFLLGQTREAARDSVVKWFKDNGLLEEVKPYRHAVGHSYRSHVAIEPYLSDQWYCRVTDDKLAGAALRALSPTAPATVPPAGDLAAATYESANTPPSDHSPQLLSQSTDAGGLTFYPARYAKTYQTWNENIRDWCISRQLWWGHRIPIYYFDLPISAEKDLGFPHDDALPDLIEEACGTVFGSSSVELLKNSEQVHVQIARHPSLPHHVQIFACLRSGDAAIETQFANWGFRQDPDVLDTWFSSGIWPLSTLGWPDKTAELQKWNPTQVLSTDRSIITLWVSRMVMFNEFLHGCLPYKDVYIHTTVLDGEGQKMSKSLGNGVNPLDAIATHGTDAMRFTIASMCTMTQDVRMPVDLVDPHSGQSFTPKMFTNRDGYTVPQPRQESPVHPGKWMVSSYGEISGEAKPTADEPLAKNTSPKFDLGRNFANKIWNGARFVIGQIAALQDGGPASAGPDAADNVPSAHQTAKVLTLADLWVLSRFNRTIDEANDALAGYRFDQYAKACYDFFWRDFCDWYVEAAKPQMRDPVRQASTARVLASVLDASLRLLHPMMPFVTEKIWWQLNEVYPERGVLGRIACPKAERCIKAQWPRRGDFSEAAEHIFGKIQDIVVAVRTLRSDFKVDAKKAVRVSIKCSDDASHRILSMKASIELLAVCTIGDVGEAVTASENAKAVNAGGCDVFVEDLIDPAAEQQRVIKRREELAKQRTALKGRLNPNYVAKAPPHLVKQTQDQLDAVEAELATLGG